MIRLSAKDNCSSAPAGSLAKKRRPQDDRWLELRNSGLCFATSIFGAPSHYFRTAFLDRARPDVGDSGISFTDAARHPGKSGRQARKSNCGAVPRRSATSDKVCYVNLREGRVLEPTTGDSSLTPRWYDGLLASPDVQGALARRLMGDRNLDSAAKSASNPPDN